MDAFAERARPKRVAQVIPCRGSKGLLRRASSGAVVEMTKTEVTCENPLRDLTVGGVKVQASPLSGWPHENLTVPLYPKVGAIVRVVVAYCPSGMVASLPKAVKLKS